MGYVVVHMQKIKIGAIGGIQSHNNREHPPQTNPDIDLSRSFENYDLVPCRNYYQAIKKKIVDLVVSKKAIRKDAVVSCNFIVTSDNETMASLGPDRQRSFFEDALKWFSDRYGADRILNATVHMDETTPHLHIGIVPITQDGRLSAKDLFTKTELKSIQTEFYRDVGAQYDLERGVEGSERTHLSEMKFKLKNTQEELSNAHDELLIAHEKLYDVNVEVKESLKKKKALEEELEDLKREKEILTSIEVEAIEGNKTLMGGLKGVSYKEFELLKKTAAVVDKALEERDMALKCAANAEERAAEAELERPSLKLQVEISHLRKIIDSLEINYPEIYIAITKSDRQQNRIVPER